MGAEVVARTRYQCSHGCRPEGDCQGHDVSIWYREGLYYFAEDDESYRQAQNIDANLLDAAVEAMTKRSDK
jgi:hypothetical protein